MRNKAFSSELKNRYDKQGKTIAQEIMWDLARVVLVRENVKEDKADFSDGFWDQIYRLSNGNEFKVEPEIKNKKWFGENFSKERPFKYDTVDIPYRKAKNQAAIHIVISSCGKYAFIITRREMDDYLQITDGQPKIKKTIYEPNGAPYFSTPVSKGFFVTKKGNQWQRWKNE